MHLPPNAARVNKNVRACELIVAIRFLRDYKNDTAADEAATERPSSGGRELHMSAVGFANYRQHGSDTIEGAFSFENDAETVSFNVESGAHLMALTIDMAEVPALIEKLAHALRLALVSTETMQ